MSLTDLASRSSALDLFKAKRVLFIRAKKQGPFVVGFVLGVPELPMVRALSVPELGRSVVRHVKESRIGSSPGKFLHAMANLWRGVSIEKRFDDNRMPSF
jgi:hypothetical protein